MRVALFFLVFVLLANVQELIKLLDGLVEVALLLVNLTDLLVTLGFLVVVLSHLGHL